MLFRIALSNFSLDVAKKKATANYAGDQFLEKYFFLHFYQTYKCNRILLKIALSIIYLTPQTAWSNVEMRRRDNHFNQKIQNERFYAFSAVFGLRPDLRGVPAGHTAVG